MDPQGKKIPLYFNDFTLCSIITGAVFITRPITFELLFLELREPLQGVWFECFEALNVDYNALVKVREKYSKDPKIGVVEAMRLWLETRDPPPSWSALVYVLRYIVMETELADRIEKYYVNPPSNQRPRPTGQINTINLLYISNYSLKSVLSCIHDEVESKHITLLYNLPNIGVPLSIQ